MHEEAVCKVDVLAHTLRDKQAACDMQQSRVDVRFVSCLCSNLI